jgi:hypothetical protein
MDKEIVDMINNRLKVYKLIYKGINNKSQIVISTTEVTIFSLQWTQPKRGNAVIKSLLNGIASEAHTLTLSLSLDGGKARILKHGCSTGDHNISFNELCQGVKQGTHKLEVKASVDAGTFKIDISNSRQLVIR